jgi:hypothetical protein
VLSIAYQLFTQLPGLQQAYARLALEDMVRGQGPEELFTSLIARPLGEHTFSGRRPALVVVDGLDEAALAGYDGIARLLASEFAKAPPWLRLIVAAERSPVLRDLFGPLEPREIDLEQVDGRADVREYLRARLGRHVAPEGLEAAVEGIVEDSRGNLQYAVCMADEVILIGTAPGWRQAFPRNLGARYLRHFKHRFQDLQAYKSRIRPALEVICGAQGPISAGMIASALAISETEAVAALAELQGLFSVADGTVRPFHPSLIDWLTVHERSGPYFVSAGSGRKRLAERGLLQPAAQ